MGFSGYCEYVFGLDLVLVVAVLLCFRQISDLRMPFVWLGDLLNLLSGVKYAFKCSTYLYVPQKFRNNVDYIIYLMNNLAYLSEFFFFLYLFNLYNIYKISAFPL